MSQVGLAYEEILHSTDRISGSDTASNFRIKLPNWYPNPNWNRIVLKQCQIDKTYYTVDANHNTFTLDENGTLTTVTVPIGIYNIESFMATIQGLLIAASPNLWTYTLSLNEIRGYIVFVVTGNAGVQPQLIFADNHLATIFGFSRPSTNSFVADTLSSTQVVQIQASEGVIVFCSHAGPDRKLQAINTATNTFNAIQFTNIAPYLNAKQLSNFSEVMDFQIVDQQNEEILDLNGHEVILTIGIYQDDPFTQSRIAELLERLIQIEVVKQEQRVRDVEEELPKENKIVPPNKDGNHPVK
jgi:hypothetical protein